MNSLYPREYMAADVCAAKINLMWYLLSFSAATEACAPAFQQGSSARNFTQPSAGHIVDESAHGNLLRHPRMRSQLLQLVAHILFDVFERIKECRRDGGGTGAVLDHGAQV